MAITIKGRIAAKDNAAIDHHEMPCEPVWLATMTGKVFACDDVNNAAKKYSFQVSTNDNMNAATMPGSAIGIIIVVKAPQIDKPSTNAASSSSVGIELNWSRIIHITMGKTVSVYSRINPMRVSKRSSDLYRTKKGKASTTGGSIS